MIEFDEENEQFKICEIYIFSYNPSDKKRDFNFIILLYYYLKSLCFYFHYNIYSKLSRSIAIGLKF